MMGTQKPQNNAKELPMNFLKRVAVAGMVIHSLGKTSGSTERDAEIVILAASKASDDIPSILKAIQDEGL